LLVACKSRRTLFCCRVSDQVDRRLLLAVSAAVLVATDLLLAAATGAASLIGGIVLWGLSVGLSQGLLAALVASAAPVERLWNRVGVPATFYAGARFAGLALLGLAQQIQVRPTNSGPSAAA